MEAPLRDWSDLPGPALLTITRFLGPIDLFAFCGACKAWRTVFIDLQDVIIANQTPLLALLKDYRVQEDSESFPPTQLYMYSVADGRLIKSSAGCGRATGCLGFSHGYLILTMDLRYSVILLVNPLTGEHHQVPSCKFSLNCATLTTSPSISARDCKVLAFPRDKKVFLMIGLLCHEWYKLRYHKNVGLVSQIAVLDDKVYGLSYNHRLLVIDISVSPIKVTRVHNLSRTFNDLSQTFNPPYVQLAVGGQELFLLSFLAIGPVAARTTALRLDASRNEWVQVDSFGGRTMFTGYWGNIYGKMTGCGDQIFDMIPPRSFRFMLNSTERKRFIINQLYELHGHFRAFWFSPYQCFSSMAKPV